MLRDENDTVRQTLIPEGAIQAAADWWAQKLADPEALGHGPGPDSIAEYRRRVAAMAAEGDPSHAELFRQVLPDFIETAVKAGETLSILDGGLAFEVLPGDREVFAVGTDYDPMPLLERALALAGIRARYPLPIKTRMLIGEDVVVVRYGPDAQIIWTASESGGIPPCGQRIPGAEARCVLELLHAGPHDPSPAGPSR